MRAEKKNTRARQEQIVAAALDLIGTEGVNALSIAAIGRRVGIVPSAVYRHFKSKEEVLDKVLESIGDRLMANVAQACGANQSAVDCLQSLLFRHAEMLDEIRAIPYVVFSDSLYVGHPERREKVHRIITGYLEKIAEIFARGQRENTLTRNVRPATGALMFLGMVLPAAVLSNVSGGRFDVIGHVKDAWPSFERAMGAAPAESKRFASGRAKPAAQVRRKPEPNAGKGR
jgi:AcrR family transcriptional regulator